MPRDTALSQKFTQLSEAGQELQHVRPTKLQEAIRQWILLLPLTTAAAGSAVVQMVDQYPQLLPPIFFIGALLVTAAMVHQRHLLVTNYKLTERVQAANQRMDTLHRLAIELSTSLNADQVGQTVLDHTLHLLEADAGALWVADNDNTVDGGTPPPDFNSLTIGDVEKESKPSSSMQWRLISSQGFDTTEQRGELWDWKTKLEQGANLSTAATEGSGQPEIHTGQSRLGADATSIMVPVSWKGQAGAAIVIKNWQRKLTAADAVLLDDIALIAGPALQNAMLYQMAAERAEYDGLTKLYNHRALQERIVQEVARVQRARQTGVERTLSLAMMDITDFKLFNDTYGHAVGDAVLRAVSDCLRHTFRVSDVVARFGGDEFVVMLPDTQYHGAETICERAVQAVGSRQLLAPDGSHISIRLTCGVAVFPDDGQNAADLLKVADTRLYVAKRQGELIINSGAGEAIAEEQTTRPIWSSIGLLEALVTAIDNKDRYTRQHSEEVWKYALLTAHEMDLSSDILQATSIASLVIDVGKIVIPDTILRKPGRLSDEEMQLMQQHPLFGTMVVKDVPHLEMVLGGVRHHHERYDGAGYPDGLSGDRIPLMGRLLAVADGYAAMTAERPYRKALSKEEALAEIEQGRGRQYDPEIAAAFVSMMRRTQEDHSALQEALRSSNVGHLSDAPGKPVLPGE